MNYQYDIEDENHDELFEEQLRRINQKKKRNRLCMAVSILLILSLILSSVIGYTGISGIVFQVLLALIMVIGGLILFYCMLFKFEGFKFIEKGVFCAVLIGVIYIFGSELCKIGLDIAQGPAELMAKTYEISYREGQSLHGRRFNSFRAIGGYFLYVRDQDGNEKEFFLPENLLHKWDVLKASDPPYIIVKYYKHINAILDVDYE